MCVVFLYVLYFVLVVFLYCFVVLGLCVNGDYKTDLDYVLFGSDVENVNELVIWSREFKDLFSIDNVVYTDPPSHGIHGFQT